MSDGFFNKQFFQQLTVATVSSVVTLVIAVGVSVIIGGQIEKLTKLAETTNQAMQTALQIIQVGPEGIAEVGGAVSDTINTTGDAMGEALGGDVGDGAAKAVETVGDAIQRFRERNEGN